MQAYSDPERENDPHALPDIEVFQLTAEEQAEMPCYEDEWNDLIRQRPYRLAGFNSRDRRALVDRLVADLGLTGGWFWQACFPGCLPDSDPVGPFASKAEALADAQSEAEGGVL